VGELKPINRSPTGLVSFYAWLIGTYLGAAIGFIWALLPDRKFWLKPFSNCHGMANIWGDQFQQSKIRGLWTACVDVQFNGSGTPTLVQATYLNNSSNVTWATAGAKGTKWGALTFTRGGTGDYTLTFQDKWTRVLSYSAMFMANGNVASPLSQIKVASNPNASGSTTGMGFTGASLSPSLNAVELLFFSSQGTVADPAATEMAVLSFMLLNSSAN